MAEVVVYVYDMTKSGDGYNAHNFSITQINKLFKDGVSLGGIFHTAVQIYGNDEWTYGHRAKGTGVFSCPAGKNPSYSLREKLVMGRTECSPSKVNKILKELSDSWPGNQYSTVSKNSNQFSNELLERLGVPKLPGWVNRFTNIAETAKGATGTLLKAKDEALKHVFHPIDFAFGRSKKNSNAKSIKATPVEFNIINNFTFITDNFVVSAPDIGNDDEHHHHHPVIQAIEEPLAAAADHDDVIHKKDEEPIITHVDDDEPAEHKDAKPVAIHA